MPSGEEQPPVRLFFEIPDPDSVDFIYKIEATSNEIDAHELSGVLESLSLVLRETYQIAHPDEGELSVRVKPFESGSFLMDIVLHIQSNPDSVSFYRIPRSSSMSRTRLNTSGWSRRERSTRKTLWI